jgi:hypothetical protein
MKMSGEVDIQTQKHFTKQIIHHNLKINLNQLFVTDVEDPDTPNSIVTHQHTRKDINYIINSF